MNETMTHAELITGLRLIFPLATEQQLLRRFASRWPVEKSDGNYDTTHCGYILAFARAVREQRAYDRLAEISPQFKGLAMRELNQAEAAYAVFADIPEGITPQEWRERNEAFHAITLTYVKGMLRKASASITGLKSLRQEPPTLDEAECAAWEDECDALINIAEGYKSRALLARAALEDDSDDEGEPAEAEEVDANAEATEATLSDDPYAEVYNPGFLEECAATAANLAEHVEDLKAELDTAMRRIEATKERFALATLGHSRACSALDRFYNNLVPKLKGGKLRFTFEPAPKKKKKKAQPQPLTEAQQAQLTSIEKRDIETEMRKLATLRVTESADKLDAALAAVVRLNPALKLNIFQRLALYFVKLTGAAQIQK